jgi:hypothetical protein
MFRNGSIFCPHATGHMWEEVCLQYMACAIEIGILHYARNCGLVLGVKDVIGLLL